MFYLFLIGAIVMIVGLLWWTYTALTQNKKWAAAVLLLPGLGHLAFGWVHRRYAKFPVLLTIIGAAIAGGTGSTMTVDEIRANLDQTGDDLVALWQSARDALEPEEIEISEVPPEPEAKPEPAPEKPAKPIIRDDPMMEQLAKQMDTSFEQIPISKMRDYPGRTMKLTLQDDTEREGKFQKIEGTRAVFQRVLRSGAVEFTVALSEIKKVELVNR